jgi:hypothetical protein
LDDADAEVRAAAAAVLQKASSGAKQ